MTAKKPLTDRFGKFTNARFSAQSQGPRPKWKLQLQQHKATLAYKASVDKKHKEEAEG